MGNIYLESALSYLDLGWAIFPAREKPDNPYLDKKTNKIKLRKEKSPYTQNGFKDASTDKYQLKEWWNKWPNACIGVSCEPSNLFLIDIDVKDGRDGINNYMMMGISDTGALHSRTPSRGLHILFTGKGKSSTNVMTGVDTRGEGGYFIAPPSCIIGGLFQGKYTCLDEWNHNPVEIPNYAIEKLHVNNNHHRKSSIDYYSPDKINTPETIEKVKSALDALPMQMVDSYHSWIEVGLSLYNLGNEGLALWDSWSKKSKRYQEGVCEEKWETFDPDEISLGSLFYYAKQNQ